MTLSTRRALLSGAAALAAAAGGAMPALAAASPDAALIALCDRFHALHAEAEATDPDVDTLLTEALERRTEVHQEIQDIRALTPAGQAAKARVAMHLLDEAFGPRWPGDFLDFGLATLAEIGGVDVPAAAEAADPAEYEPVPLVYPDAELLAACAAADAIQTRIDVLWEDHALDEDEAGRDALVAVLDAEEEPHLDKVYDLRAQTLAGHMARARTLAGWDKEALKKGGSWDRWLASALVRDLVGEDGA